MALELLTLTPTVRSVKDLADEEEELKFEEAFRELMRLRNILESFSEFEDEGLALTAQRFADYRSAYLDLYDKVKTDTQEEKASRKPHHANLLLRSLPDASESNSGGQYCVD